MSASDVAAVLAAAGSASDVAAALAAAGSASGLRVGWAAVGSAPESALGYVAAVFVAAASHSYAVLLVLWLELVATAFAQSLLKTLAAASLARLAARLAPTFPARGQGIRQQPELVRGCVCGGGGRGEREA